MLEANAVEGRPLDPAKEVPRRVAPDRASSLRVLLITMGGTIARVGKLGKAGRLDGEELLRQVPEVRELCEIDTVDMMKSGSSAIGPAEMSALAREIHDRVQSGIDGIVVTQGTDTLEETAYALALQLKIPAPVVLTGAMRRPGEAGADGPGNLLGAIRVATTPGVAVLGPLVVMQDEIHCARLVTKAHSTSVTAFASPGFGPVGYIADGFAHMPTFHRANDYVGLPPSLPHRVEVVWTFSGCDGGALASAADRADGVVVAAMGNGRVPPGMLGALKAAVETRKPLILASRCGAGPVLSQTYNFGDAGNEVGVLGVVPAGDLAPVKARLRLLVALGLGIGPESVFPAGGY